MKIATLLAIAATGVLLSMLPKQEGAFQYTSLKGKSDEEIDRFMGGKASRSSFEKENPTPNSFPENHWMKNPHEAAVAFVQANRSVSGKPKQGDGTSEPPESGWIVYDWTSSGCYSLSTSVTAIRFGVDQPFIFHSSSNQNGVVGRNPFVDRLGRTLDIIDISPDEARFISQLVFRINDFRGRGEKDRFIFSSVSSTADGSGIIDLHPTGKPPIRIDGRIWAGRSIHDSWEGPFHDEAAANLIHYFLTEVVPDRLGKRWPDHALEYRSIVTPMEERVKPRADSDVLDEFSRTVNIALEKHQADPWPAAALQQVVASAGELGLDKTRFNIERLAKKAPPVTVRETRLRELSKEEHDRFMRGVHPDPFDKPAKADEEKKRKERMALAEEFRYDLPFIIREPLRLAIGQIDAVHDSGKLSTMAEKQDASGIWALQQLQVHHPKIYSKLMIGRFQNADARERSALFITLVAVSPEGADKLRGMLSEDDQKALVIELTEFELGRHPETAQARIPVLLEILEDEEGTRPWITRGRAIELLSKLPLDDNQRMVFEDLLIREIRNPRRDDHAMSIVSFVYSAIGRLPDPERHWELLITNAGNATGFSDFDALLQTLALIVRKNPDAHRQEFVGLLKARLTNSRGLMNDLFETALAMDLRELSPDILALASTGPDVPDGKGANSWGGDFTGPGELDRYHAARHVSALWQESDPETLARMWASLVIEQPHEFNRSLFLSDELIQRCRDAFGKVPAPVKAALIARIQEKCPDYRKLVASLGS